MSRAKKIAAVLLAAIVLLAACLWIFQKPISMHVLARMAHRNVGRDIIATLPDGLHVVLCGTGSPMPDPTRAGPCTAVIAGERLFVVDAGEGSSRNLAYMGVPLGRIEALLLTHFHSDHIDGMGNFMLQRWANRMSQTPLPVIGPTGVEQVVDGFRAAYVLDFGYRVAHHSPKIMPAGGSGGKGVPFDLPAAGQGDQVVVLNDNGLKITAFRVNHAPIEPAVGYRFDYKGRSVVISGDTKKAQSVADAAKGADLLIHEALQPALLKLITNEFEARKVDNITHILTDIVNYHTTPEEAAQIAMAAGVRQLVFNHIVPPMPIAYGYAAFMGDASQFFSGPMAVGEDGMLFSMPAGGTDILKSRLN
jgi:ribonuclease Z